MTRRVSLTEFERICTNFAPELRDAYVRGLRRAALRLERYTVEEIDSAKPSPAVDTGELRQSVDATFVEDGAVVSVDAPHAPMMEYGTRPFRPPLAPLAEWAKRKGYATTDAEARAVAWRVADAIAERGIEPRSYFGKAWDRMLAELPQDIALELARLRR